MRGLSRQLGIVTFLAALCAAALLGGPSTALGGEPGDDRSTPTVSFVDEAPLALDPAAVEALLTKKKGVLTVRVHNDLGSPQPVTLELVGLDEASDPGIAALFATNAATQQVGAGETATLTLTLEEPRPTPDPGAYDATLLAFGRSGGFARRPLTVTYPADPGRTETAGENSLNPARPIDITLHAVNFLPSLLANLLGLGIFLTIALVAIAVLFRRTLYALGGRLPKVIGAGGHGPFGLVLGLGILCGAVTLVGLIEDGIWDSPGFHAISPRPVALAPSVPDGVRGTVSSENGTIAQLIAADGKLRPENLGGADKYVGKYNLGGEPEKTGGAATVTIRDFWIYAVAAITLGLLVGFALHRWFQEQRPKAKLRARLEGLRHNYDADISGTQPTYVDSPYKDVRIDSRLLSRDSEIRSLLDAGETAEATEKLLALGVYLDRFATLREKRRNLENAVAELEHADVSRLGLELADARGYRIARRLLMSAADPTGLDSDEEELKADVDRVEELTELIEGTGDQVKISNQWLIRADALRVDCDEEQLEKLGKAGTKLKEAGQAALQADSVERLEEARKTGDTGVRDLVTLDRQVKGPADSTAIVDAVQDARMLTAEIFDRIAIEDEKVAPVVAAASRPEAPGVEAAISWTVLGVEGPDATEIHIEDYVQFTIEFRATEQPPFPQVEVDFGEGVPVTYNVPRLDRPLIVTHRYRTQPQRQVDVRVAAGGAVLASTTDLTVDPEVRLLPSQVDLAATEGVVKKAAFVLAVGSGLVALYIRDPSWGEPVDYLAAFLWGGATGQGVQFAAGIADRVWPAP